MTCGAVSGWSWQFALIVVVPDDGVVLSSWSKHELLQP